MIAQELTGYYTYRSFMDLPLPVDDFNKIKFAAEAELFLIIQADGSITGTMSFPAEPGASEKDISQKKSTILCFPVSDPVKR
jgi:hypothetical protein